MYKCKFCNKEIDSNNKGKIGGHVRNCLLNPNRKDSYEGMKKYVKQLSIVTSEKNLTNYSNNPKKCEQCNNELSYDKKQNRFCSHSCATTFNNSKRPKKNVEPKIKKKKLISVITKKGDKVEIVKNKLVTYKCPVCDKEEKVTEYIFHKKKYCSGTCRNKINNLMLTGSTSKSEKYLLDEIKKEFPDILIKPNNRNVLNGLEIDIYLPTLKIGIEWNGIYHHKDVHKDGSYERIKNSDERKLKLADEKKINLIVINDLTSSPKFMKEKTNEIIEYIRKFSTPIIINNQ